MEFESPDYDQSTALTGYQNTNSMIPENNDPNIIIDPFTHETIAVINLDDDNSDTISEDWSN